MASGTLRSQLPTERPSPSNSVAVRKLRRPTTSTTGRELWTQGWNAEYTDSTGDGPRSTPTWDEGRLYVLGATGELRCLDAKTGRVIWGKNILSENGASNLPWAMAASPLIVDDKVIVLPGGSGGKSVVAYNKMTGAPVWKSLDDRQAYVSPMLVTLAAAGKSWSSVRRARLASSLKMGSCFGASPGTRTWVSTLRSQLS